MDLLIPEGIPALSLILALLVGVAAGFVKGAVGFGMPLVLVSGLGAVLPAETALAALILPTLVTNGVQSLRNGVAEAVRTILAFRIFIAVVLVTMLFAAQLVPRLPGASIYLAIGVPVTLFAVIQIVGWQPVFRGGRTRALDAGFGVLAGVTGGLSGIWGPPTVVYLLATGSPKDQHLRIQGVVYGLGSVMLVIAHIRSGIFTTQSAPFSAEMVLPALIGMYAGMKLSDRLDQKKFLKLTQLVLVLAGLNLIRRGLWG